MTATVSARLKNDPVTGWDCLTGSVDGTPVHAISFPREDGNHRGSIVGNAMSYPISLPHSICDTTESELAELWHRLTSS